MKGSPPGGPALNPFCTRCFHPEMTDPTSTSPYLRAAARLRAQAELKLQARQAEEQTERARDDEGIAAQTDPSE